MRSKPWNETYQRWAVMAVGLLLADAAARDDREQSAALIRDLFPATSERSFFLKHLRGAKVAHPKRTLRMVCALAEGRFEYAVAWKAKDPAWHLGDLIHEGGSDPEKDARAACVSMGGKAKGWRVARATYIRRARGKR